MSTRDVEEIFARAAVGGYEDGDAWAAVDTLRQNGSQEIFDYAAAWLESGEPLKRARAAAILCQLRRPGAPTGATWRPEWVFREESCLLITKMMEHEVDPLVLDSAISALGHLGDPAAIPLILRYQDEPDSNVRFAVAFALGCFPHETRSVQGLLKLTWDNDAEVRDWAVFGLGVQGGADSVEIREALFRCLGDPDEDVREEAAVGLGKRRDRRLLAPLLKMLSSPELKIRIEEAAAALLELKEPPRAWSAADYRSALTQKFNTPG